MHADKKKKILEWSMPGYSENCVSGGGEIIVYKSPTYSKCLLLAQCPKHVTKCDLYSFCSINEYSMVYRH